MKELADVVTCLLDVDDGSCRDLNFERPRWDGVEDLIGSLAGSFTLASATDHDGRVLADPLRDSAVAAARDGRSVHLELQQGAGLVKRLQMFLIAERDGSPFVELTFFPTDVVPTQTLNHDFREWATELTLRLRACRCYARYENASWEFGDSGPTSGVFWVSDDLEPDA